MIGDWVHNKHHKKNIRLTQYDFFTHTHNDFGEQELAPFAKPTIGRDLEPIPLTAEMLSKLGFKKKGNRYGIYDDYFDFEMHEYNDGIWVVSYHCCEMSLPDEQLLICYIHQLQHFMRHCGIDKTIEL